MRDDFRVSPSPSTVLVGDNVVLRCVPPKAVPPAVVSWTRDGSTLSLDSAKRARVDDDGNLVILNAGKEDEGRTGGMTVHGACAFGGGASFPL